MAVDSEDSREEPDDPEEIVLPGGETLSELLEEVDLESDETCSADEMRERLGL